MDGDHRVILAAAALALAASGCRKREPVELSIPAPSARPSAQAPVDHLLPGELAEGSEKAFGLPLPRLVTVRGRFSDTVFGVGEVPPDQLANYVRQRVSAEKVETGPVKTVFSRATVRGQPGVELSIQVLSRGSTTELQVKNLSLVKGTPGLTDEERWRAAGLKPDGTLLDPTHLH
jgi:hypothetical protein